jgi:hypothetical protein
VVAAVTILAVIGASLAGFYSTMITGTRAAERMTELDAVAGEVDEIIAGDLAFLAAVDDASPVRISEKANGASTLVFHSAVGSRTAWGEPATPLHRITYLVDRMPDGRLGLFRGEEPIVETPGAYYGPPLLVVGGVSSFVVEASNGSDDFAVWPAEGAEGIPVLITVTVVFSNENGGRTVFIESCPPVDTLDRPKAVRWTDGAGDGAEGSESSDSGGDLSGDLGP